MFIGAVVAVLCFGPFILVSLNTQKKKKNTARALEAVAAKYNGNIDEKEVNGHYALGIDKQNNKVFFYNAVKDTVTEQFVDLTNVSLCKVNSISRTFKERGKIQSLVDRIEILFLPEGKEQRETTFELFNADISLQGNGEIPFAEVWTRKINEQIRNIKK
ncbi:hypothetical protein DMZ48_14615 [Robertkochia solimangrovi]|nr:hypothetical protein DMZ48_14615 [Robertkochia solimangrovi]